MGIKTLNPELGNLTVLQKSDTLLAKANTMMEGISGRFKNCCDGLTQTLPDIGR